MFAPLFLFLAHATCAPAALYADEAHRELLFVPATMVQSHESAARTALEQIAQFEMPEGLDCMPPPEFDALVEVPPSFSDYLRQGPEVFVANVTGIVTGWDTRNANVASLVTLRIRDVLHGGPAPLRKGTQVTILVPGGSFELDRKRLCTKPQDEIPHIGEDLLIRGVVDEHNSGHIATCNDCVFPIENGDVVVSVRLLPDAPHIPLIELTDRQRHFFRIRAKP